IIASSPCLSDGSRPANQLALIDFPLPCSGHLAPCSLCSPLYRLEWVHTTYLWNLSHPFCPSSTPLCGSNLLFPPKHTHTYTHPSGSHTHTHIEQYKQKHKHKHTSKQRHMHTCTHTHTHTHTYKETHTHIHTHTYTHAHTQIHQYTHKPHDRF